MRRVMRLLAGVLATSALVFAAGPPVLRMAPEDAVWIGNLKFHAFAGSPIGERLLARLDSGSKGFQSLAAAAGFDPMRDLREIFFYSSDVRLDAGDGVLVLSGKFDGPRIESWAAAQGAERSVYQDVPFYRKNDTSPALALLSDTLLMVGDAGLLRAGIARYQAEGGQNDGLLAQLESLNDSHDAWILNRKPKESWAAREPRPSQPGQPSLNAGLFETMQSASLSLRFGQNVEVEGDAETRTQKDAAALVDLVRFLRGMLQMNKKSPRNELLSKVLMGVQPKAEGNRFQATLTLTGDDFDRILELTAPAKKPAEPDKSSGEPVPSTPQP